MNKTKLLLASILLATSITLFGQEQEKNIILNEVEISAKSIDIYSDLGRAVTVIDQLEITQKGVNSIDDLLEFAAGVDVRSRGTNGIQADVSIRGGSSDQLLVLLNGVNITDPQTGHFAMDVPIAISDIERVEILQGSAARVLGVNAFSGAVNIVTKAKNKNQLTTTTQTGSFGYLSQELSGNLMSEKFNGIVSLQYKQSDGYRKNTDFNNANAYLSTEWKSKSYGRVNAQLAYQQKSFGANSFYSEKYPNQFEHTKTLFGAIKWDYNKNRISLHSQLAYRRHHDRFELFRNFKDALPWYSEHNYHLTDVVSGKATAVFQENFGKSTLGIDVRYEQILSNVLGAKMKTTRPVPFEDGVAFTKSHNRTLATVFFDQQVTYRNWYFSLGTAATTYQGAENFVNYGADVSYKLSPIARVYVAANSAIRLPTLTDLFYQSKDRKSNPNLKPEESLTLEAGTKVSSEKVTFSASAYYRFGKNIIDWVKAPDVEIWESKNLTQVNATGVDLQATYRFDNSFLRRANAVYSFTHLDKSADHFDSKYALDYLKHKLVVELSHKLLKNSYINWSYMFNDRSGTYTEFSSQKLLDYRPFGLISGKIIWEKERIELFGEINNILNTKYIDFGGIPLPGVHFNVGIKLTVNK